MFLALPDAQAPALLYMSPYNDYLSFGSLKANVSSVLNRINGQAITQTTLAAQPTWKDSDIDLRPSFEYAGSQYLQYNTLATLLSKQDLTVSWLAKCSLPSSGTRLDMLSFGNTGTTAGIEVGYASSNYVLRTTNDAGTTVTTNVTGADNKVHVFTLIKSGTTCTLRLDGKQVAQQTGLSGVYTLNTFTVGGFNSNGSVTNTFQGAEGHLAAFKGVAAYINVEDALKNVSGQLQ